MTYSTATPWLISPDWADRIEASLRVASDPARIAAFWDDGPPDRAQAPPKLDVRSGGVAVLPIHGVITPRPSLMGFIMEMMYGGATYLDILSGQLSAAIADPSVRSILLDINSPGGEVTGVAEMAESIRTAASIKPIIAHTPNLMASAAYWLGASSGEMWAAKMSRIGCLGVLVTVHDDRGKQEKDGVRRYEFVSDQSPDKIVDPATESGAMAYRELATALAEPMLGDISTLLGVPLTTVLDDFGRGALMPAGEAMSVGMIDRVGSFNEALAKLAGPSRGRLAKVKPANPASLPASASSPLVPLACIEPHQLQLLTGGQTWDGPFAGPAPAPTLPFRS